MRRAAFSVIRLAKLPLRKCVLLTLIGIGCDCVVMDCFAPVVEVVVKSPRSGTLPSGVTVSVLDSHMRLVETGATSVEGRFTSSGLPLGQYSAHLSVPPDYAAAPASDTVRPVTVVACFGVLDSLFFQFAEVNGETDRMP